ncbi:hypothetical protein ABIB85_008075 [Bradyrhizobium sp. JR1.5]|uniref:alpha/beta hydrolase family protein n=1 Tax=unclassified Bradyrhizobium TaxID=2631580 RepID=UPI00339B822E
MACAAWPYVRGDLASTRRGAAAFLDNLGGVYGAAGLEAWATSWTNVGDAHSRIADLRVDEGAFDDATEAWLSALTAFEVARRLDEDDRQRDDVSAKLETGIQRIGSLGLGLERVQIAGGDQAEFQAHYLAASGPELRAPAVICISSEEEIATALLGRILPVVTTRGMSILVVSHDDVSNRWRGQSETLLSCCLDYLSDRSDVDPTRIGVYGEGLSAVLATDFAVSDRRIAAAVCDGGLWNWARTLTSVRWMTGTAADVVGEDVASVRRSRLVRQLRCPVLVVVGGRGTVSASEAIKLQAECRAARIDLELVMPRTTLPPKGIDNFVTSDDCVFGWLERKLIHSSAS